VIVVAKGISSEAAELVDRGVSDPTVVVGQKINVDRRESSSVSAEQRSRKIDAILRRRLRRPQRADQVFESLIIPALVQGLGSTASMEDILGR
jgi:hypothetical protein